MSFIKRLQAKKEQLAEATADLVSGARVSSDQRQQRLTICQRCEHLSKTFEICKLCGCTVRSKTWLPSQTCPINNW
jgi:hypothetical protein